MKHLEQLYLTSTSIEQRHPKRVKKLEKLNKSNKLTKTRNFYPEGQLRSLQKNTLHHAQPTLERVVLATEKRKNEKNMKGTLKKLKIKKIFECF